MSCTRRSRVVCATPGADSDVVTVASSRPSTDPFYNRRLAKYPPGRVRHSTKGPLTCGFIRLGAASAPLFHVLPVSTTVVASARSPSATDPKGHPMTTQENSTHGSYVVKGEPVDRDMHYIDDRITRDGRDGWPVDAGRVDPVLGYERLQQAYCARFPDYPRGITVPAVVDVPSRAVVTNDFQQLTLDFATEWSEHHREGAPDLYPAAQREEIDALNRWMLHHVNNGVYKTGFAGSQAVYEREYRALWAALDELEERL